MKLFGSNKHSIAFSELYIICKIFLCNNYCLIYLGIPLICVGCFLLCFHVQFLVPHILLQRDFYWRADGENTQLIPCTGRRFVF